MERNLVQAAILPVASTKGKWPQTTSLRIENHRNSTFRHGGKIQVVFTLFAYFHKSFLKIIFNALQPVMVITPEVDLIC